MSKGPDAFFGSSYKGCGNSRQQSNRGHQDYIHLVGGACEEDFQITVDRFCGGALDCVKSSSDSMHQAAKQGTVCSKKPYDDKRTQEIENLFFSIF